MTDFEAFRHPVLAVACPDCHQRPGSWCKRPSEHKAMDLHAARLVEADRVFIEQHGEAAWIENTGGEPMGWGVWKVHATGHPVTTVEPPAQMAMF